MQVEPIITANWRLDNSFNIDVYEEHGGYKSLKKALSQESSAIIDEVKKSNLRGRGGAGFPTGLKWSFLPKESDVPKYLVINADEGEPGTWKDRWIMELDPHRLIEGCIITAHTLNLRASYIYIRGEMRLAAERLEEAIREAYAKGYLGESVMGSGLTHDIYVHRGAGAYICGEETALIESLEGKAGKPRLKPPFPAVVGVFGCPTVVNNVETIAWIPTVIDRGGQWFADAGSERNGGYKIMQLSGQVKKPGIYEVPNGLSLRDAIFSEEFGGGMRDGKVLKAVIPGGLSCPLLKADEIDVGMDFDQLAKAGTMGGTAGVVAIDQDTCMVRMALRTARFYAHESCGQCTPCREGTGWVERIIEKIEAGMGQESDLQLLEEICDNVQGNTICPLGDAMAMPIRSYVQKFPEEFLRHVQEGRCPHPEW